MSGCRAFEVWVHFLCAVRWCQESQTFLWSVFEVCRYALGCLLLYPVHKVLKCVHVGCNNAGNISRKCFEHVCADVWKCIDIKHRRVLDDKSVTGGILGNEQGTSMRGKTGHIRVCDKTDTCMLLVRYPRNNYSCMWPSSQAQGGPLPGCCRLLISVTCSEKKNRCCALLCTVEAYKCPTLSFMHVQRMRKWKKFSR